MRRQLKVQRIAKSITATPNEAVNPGNWPITPRVVPAAKRIPIAFSFSGKRPPLSPKRLIDEKVDAADCRKDTPEEQHLQIERAQGERSIDQKNTTIAIHHSIMCSRQKRAGAKSEYRAAI